MNRTIFTKLRNVLMSLYPTERSIRRVADDAGIDLARIEIHAHAQDDWHALLTEAKKQNQIDALLAVAKSEYGNNKALREACDEYCQSQCKDDEEVSSSPQLENPPNDNPIANPPQSPLVFDWLYIEASDFIMGLNRTEYADVNDWETPRHQRYLADFWITRTPVTVAQFAHFVQVTGYKTTAENSGKSYVATGSKLQWIARATWQRPYGPDSNIYLKGNHPVTCVSWYDALAFCQWAGVTLPSEAEWEKVARGKTCALYPWGHELPSRSLCNFNANAGDTLPVGTFPDGASPYQALDMAGNVWEWTRSLWGTETATPEFRYPYQPDDGRENLQAPAAFLRVGRGGSWDSRAAAMRTTFRGRFDPSWSYNHVGFRVAWSSRS